MKLSALCLLVLACATGCEEKKPVEEPSKVPAAVEVVDAAPDTVEKDAGAATPQEDMGAFQLKLDGKLMPGSKPVSPSLNFNGSGGARPKLKLNINGNGNKLKLAPRR